MCYSTCKIYSSIIANPGKVSPKFTCICECACVCVNICVHVCECMHVSALPVSMPRVYEERDIGRNNEDKKKGARRQGKPGGKVKKLEDSKRVQLHKDNGCN